MSTRRKVIAAIDFGTTYSGLSYAFDDDNGTDPPNIMVKTWYTGKRCMLAFRIPSTILLDPQKNFHSFGYEAETKYSELINDGEHECWFFFRRLKFLLYDKKTHRINKEIADTRNRRIKSSVIYSMAINYMKKSLLEFLKKKYSNISEFNVKWVILIPAIWHIEAEQLMKQAATEAGIQSENVTTVIEPVATSVFCRSTYGVDNFVVIHAGGCTTDITRNCIQDGGKLKISIDGSTGQWSGTSIEYKFKRLLCKIFGEEVIRIFEQEHMGDYLELFGEFEAKRNGLKSDQSGFIRINTQTKLVDLFKDMTGNDIENVLPYTSLGGNVKWFKRKALIHADMFKGFFEESVNGMIKQTEVVLDALDPRFKSQFFMDGGFAMASVLQDQLRDAFPEHNIIIPDEAGLLSLKGGVLYGINSEQILHPVDVNTIALPQEISQMEIKSVALFKNALKTGKVKSRNINLLIFGQSTEDNSSFAEILLKDTDHQADSKRTCDMHKVKCLVDLKTGRWLPIPTDYFDHKIKYSCIWRQSRVDGTRNETSVTDDRNYKAIKDHDETTYVHPQCSSFDHAREIKQTARSINQGDQKVIDSQKRTGQSVEDDGHIPEKIRRTTEETHMQSPEYKPSIIGQMSSEFEDAELEEKIMEIRNDKIVTSDQEAIVRLSDYTGKKVFFTTFLRFLSYRAIFFLTFNIGIMLKEEGLEQRNTLTNKESEKTRLIDYLHFMVKTIIYYARYRFSELPRIVFVGLDKDASVSDADREKLFNDIVDHFKGSKAEKHLIIRSNLCLVANSTTAISSLKHIAIEEAKQQPFWEEMKPASWVALEERLIHLGQQTPNCIMTTDEIKLQNAANKISVIPPDEIVPFLEFQHSLGNIIFLKEKFLENFVILNYNWVSDVLMSLVDGDEVHHRYGKDSVKKALSDGIIKSDYIHKKLQKILNNDLDKVKYSLLVMEKIGIIVKPQLYTESGEDAQENFYYVPSSLREDISADITKELYKYLQSPNYWYIFQDNFLPPAVYDHFIACCLKTWPVSKYKDDHCLFTDLAAFDLDEYQRLVIRRSGHKINIQALDIRGTKTIDLTLASGIQDFLSSTLTKILQNSNPETEMSYAIFDITVPCKEADCYLNHKYVEETSVHSCDHMDHMRKVEVKEALKPFFYKQAHATVVNRENGYECESTCSGPTQEELDDRPSDRELGRVSRRLTSPTMVLGMKLDLRSSIISNIISNNHKIEDQRFHILSHWMAKSEDPLFRKLFDELKDLGENSHIICQVKRIDCSLEYKQPPNVRMLDRIANHIGNRMFQLGLELNFPCSVLEEIQQNHRDICLQQTKVMLRLWYDKHKMYTARSLNMLALGLQEVGISCELLKDHMTL